ncbi:MAG: ornithine cyclodeaminase family protein [Gammaproteobacteria bacterium]|nr:ornithine cyclodeaminase family protein [Gammaproteobacteria bacterium]
MSNSAHNSMVDKMLYLSKSDLKSLNITTDQAIESLEFLIKQQTKSEVWTAPKTVVRPDHRYLMTTLSAANEPNLMSVKSLILNQKNPEKGLSAINSLITLLDGDTGVPKAVMDGNWVTAMRTACASAVAARCMANRNSSVVAFIGCGVQANSHLQAYSDLFPLSEIRAFGRGAHNRDALCESAISKGLKAVACDSPEQAVAGADLIVTSIPMTIEVDPFIDCNWLKPGAFVSSTDMGLPFMTKTLSVLDRIIIDDFEQERSMPNPMAPTELISGDITSLVTGNSVGRGSENERTMFLFRAVVLGDLALSALAYQTAIEKSIGTVLSL